MLKIGEFSKLSQITVQALHHYDEIGLLKPVKVDPFTNYRYYSVDQLPQIHRIIALKELGLSLEQIRLMISTNISVEQIREMLLLKQAESQQRVREEKERLRRIEFRLQMIDIDKQMPTLDVVIKKIPASVALTVRRSMTQQNMIPFGIEVEKALVAHNVKRAGPVTEIRFEKEFQPVHNDVLFAWPVSSLHKTHVPLATFGTLEPQMIDGLPKVASYVVHGLNPEQIADQMTLFRHWILDNGYQLCPSHRLVFHNGPTEHAEYKDWIIEFQHEVMLVDEAKD